MKGRIVVCGGGIAGSMFALSVARGCGVAVSVVEQRDAVESSSGGGLGLWGPAQLAMRAVGVTMAGQIMESAAYRADTKRTILAPTPIEKQAEGPSKVIRSCLCLERSQLQEAINRELKKFSPLVTFVHASVTSVAKDGRSLTLSNGKVLQDIDLLVGADGWRSRVRTDVFPWIKDPVYSQYTYWRGVSSSGGSKERAFETWAPGRRYGIVPLSEDRCFWFVAVVGRTSMTREELEAEFPSLARVIRDSSIIHETPIFDMERLDRYHFASTVLIGDAAHVMAPNLAQGAQLAIEDALQLASNLAHFPIEEALVRFSAARTKRVHRVQRLVVAEHWVGTRSGALEWARNLLFLVPHFVKTPIFDLTHRWALGWNYTPPHLPLIGLYERVLGPAQFNSLAKCVQLLHGHSETATVCGTASVKASLIARLMMGFKSYHGPFVLNISRKHGAEIWTRQFGGAFVFETRQWSLNNQLMESFGPFWFAFDLKPEENGFSHTLSRVSLGKWIPFPRFLIKLNAVTKGDACGKFNGSVVVALFGKWTLLEYHVVVV